MSSTLGFLQNLRENGLKAKLSKCEFNKAELHLLGHVIGKDGVAVDPTKIAIIDKWPLPKSLKELHQITSENLWITSVLWLRPLQP
jgi:hypothetical protein